MKTSPEKNTPVLYLLTITLAAALGGFLFGFDSGVISGAVGALREAFNASSFGSGFNVSSMLLGCAVGALLAGGLAEKWGRLKVLRVSAVFFFVSAWGSGIAESSLPFVVYRVLGGFAVGAASVVCPAYISEIAPARIRGRLASLQQMAIVLGLFLSFLCNYWIAEAAGSASSEFWLGYDAWKWMFWAEMLPALLFGVALFLIPESPRFLVRAGKEDLALRVLTKLGHVSDAKEKVKDIRQSFASSSSTSYRNVFNPKSGRVETIVWLGLLVAAFQQLSGINIIFYYGPVMWQAAGFSETSALFKTVLSGGLNIVCTLIAIACVDKIGRKPMLFWGAIGMFLCLSLVAYTFMRAPTAADGSLAMDPGQGLTALIAANGYVAFFAMTWGPVVWVLLGEMFPNRMRGVALALSGMVMWLANFVITGTFETLLETLGLSVTYGGYAAFALLSVFFVARYIEETKDKTLEQM